MDFQEYDNLAGGRGVIKVLQLMGLWRYEGARKNLYTFYSLLLHFTISVPYTIMMCIDAFHAADLEKFSNTMYMTLTELGLLAKLVNVWCYGALMVDFFATLANDALFQLQSVEERQSWARQQKQYSWLVFTFFSMALVAVCIAFVGVLFSADYELPYPYAPPFDWRTKRGYLYAYCYELLAMPITCLSNCAFDMIQCYMLKQISLYFKLICERLQRMGEIRGTANGFSEEKFNADFIRVLSVQLRTRELSQQCEKFVSFPFLVQILCSSFVLCFSGYRLQKLLITKNISQFSSLLQTVLLLTLQIFIPCFYGNEIIKYSSGLNNAIFNSNWVQCSPKTRKYLITYMEMLQRPVQVRAGNFFHISLAMFSKTLNNTYHLIALLLNMNK